MENNIISIPVSGMSNCDTASVKECDFEGFKDIVSRLEELYPGFNVSDYKITVNMYSENKKDGIIMLTYYIGENILTNKVYIISVKDNIATEIIPSSVINPSSTACMSTKLVGKKGKIFL